MTKLNTGSRLVKAPLQTEKIPTGKTHEGGAGFTRDDKTQLFLGCTTTFAGEGSFYESAEAHDERMIALIKEIAVSDFKWVEGFLPWLRQDAFIRTSAVMLAAEVAHALNGKDHMTMRVAKVVDGSMNRADEVTEIVAYCLSHFGVVPVAVREGVKLAILRMWNQRSVLRWDKTERPVRFADVIEIVHPNPRKVQAPRDLVLTHKKYEGWQSWEARADFEANRYNELDRLFKYLLDERHHGDRSVLFEDNSPLRMIRARAEMSRLTPAERHAFAAKALEGERSETFEDRELYRAAAGQWEFIRSWLGEGARNLKTALTDRQQWELVFPWMGYEAVLKNLRNFDQAGITPKMIKAVQDRIADPEQVANSRQLPYRFLTAHLNTRSAYWLMCLEEAMTTSIRNVPLMRGRGLVMIDMSGSMQNPLAQPKSRGKRDDDSVVPTRLQAAGLFAMALALRNAGHVQVFGFADAPGSYNQYPNWLHREKKFDGHVEFQHIEPGASLLRLMDFVVQNIGACGYGTAIEQNLRQCYDGHDWVAIFSDEQTIPGGPGWRSGWGDIGDITHVVPPEVPVFGWNLAGYQHGAFPTGGRRFSLGGLNDSSFELMRRLMDGHSAKWPWE